MTEREQELEVALRDLVIKLELIWRHQPGDPGPQPSYGDELRQAMLALGYSSPMFGNGE